MLTLEQRAEQITVTRAQAAAAGRDPAAPEYTRWGQIDMTADEVQARASQGVAWLVVSPSSTELAGMQAEVSSYAHRLGLGCTAAGPHTVAFANRPATTPPLACALTWPNSGLSVPGEGTQASQMSCGDAQSQ
jgi:hypothetical protein